MATPRTPTKFKLYEAADVLKITSSTNASPSVVTIATHNLVTGDKVIVAGHATNTALNGMRSVVKINANTFSLLDVDGNAVNGNGIGAATGFIVKVTNWYFETGDFQHVAAGIRTAGTADMTMKCVISYDDTPPNFGAAISDSNDYNYAQLNGLADQTDLVKGGDGIAPAGTDIDKYYEVNINGAKYVTFIPTGSTASTGTFSAFLQGFTNK